MSGGAPIAAVPTLIAGIWGMNFNMPGLDWRLGFAACLAVMLLIAVARTPRCAAQGHLDVKQDAAKRH